MVWGHPLFSTYPSLAGWWEYRNRKPLDRNHRRNPWFPIGSPIGRSVSQSIDPWISIKKRLICEPIPIIHHFWDQESLSDWWFETIFLMFPLYWECHHPNWRTHSIIFQRARWLNHQPAIHGVSQQTAVVCAAWSQDKYVVGAVSGGVDSSVAAAPWPWLNAGDGIAMGGWVAFTFWWSFQDTKFRSTIYIYIHKAIFWGDIPWNLGLT